MVIRPARDLFRLDGRIALVTGASAGLGSRFAAVLHQAGAHVVLTARRQERLEELAAGLGERVTVLPGDIREPTRSCGADRPRPGAVRPVGHPGQQRRYG